MYFVASHPNILPARPQNHVLSAFTLPPGPRIDRSFQYLADHESDKAKHPRSKLKAMAIAQNTGASHIIDLTEDDEILDTNDFLPKSRNATVLRSIAGSESPKRPVPQETLDSAVSRADAASLLLNSRMKSFKQSSKPTSYSNPRTTKKSESKDQIARTVSNVLQRPANLGATPSPRPLPYQPPNSSTIPRIGILPRVGEPRPGPRQPSPAKVSQEAQYTVWDLPESDWEDNMSGSDKSRRDTPKTTPESAQSTLATNRTPRIAARDASRAITGSYEILNFLEARLEATTTSPRKPGRPKKDEWRPPHQSGSGHRREESKIKIIGPYSKPNSVSPTPRKKFDSTPATKDSTQSEAVSYTLTKKRKLSSASKDGTPLFKLSRTSSLRLPQSDNTVNSVQTSHEVHGDTQQFSWKSNSDVVQPALRGHKDPQLVREQSSILQISDSVKAKAILNAPTDSVPGSQWLAYSMPADVAQAQEPSQSVSSHVPTVSAAVTNIYEMIVDPAIKKAEKRYKGRLPGDQLKSISRDVSGPSSQVPILLNQRANICCRFPLVLRKRNWHHTFREACHSLMTIRRLRSSAL